VFWTYYTESNQLLEMALARYYAEWYHYAEQLLAQS